MVLLFQGENFGEENKFGDVDPTDGTSQKMGRNHKLAVQDGAGLGSIAKVNLELHYVDTLS